MLGVQKTHDPGTAAGTRMAAPARVEQASLPAGPELLDRLREALRSRHYRRRMREAYCHEEKRFSYFQHVRHPAEMGEPEIGAFLTHLAVKQKVNALTQNQAASAILFLYRNVIGGRVGELGDVVRAQRPNRVPVVMTRGEVKAVLGQVTGDKSRMASLMYGVGLRWKNAQTASTGDITLAHLLNRGPAAVRSPVDQL